MLEIKRKGMNVVRVCVMCVCVKQSRDGGFGYDWSQMQQRLEYRVMEINRVSWVVRVF